MAKYSRHAERICIDVLWCAAVAVAVAVAVAIAVTVAVVWCVVVCVLWCVLWCVWSVATLERDSWLLLSLVSACFEFLATLTFGALRRNHSVSTAFETIAKKNTRRPRAVSNVS